MPDPATVFVTLTGTPPNDGVPPHRTFAATAMPPPQYREHDADPLPPFDGVPLRLLELGQAAQRPPSPAPRAPVDMPALPGIGMGYPPYYAPFPIFPGVIPMTMPAYYPGYFPAYPMPMPFYPGFQPQHPPPPPPPPPPAPPGPPAPPAAAPPPPPPAAHQPPYEPPGQHAPQHGQQGYTLLGTPERCIIHFINDGSRPCDTYPLPFRHVFNFSIHHTLCSLTIKELLGLLGCPEGNGRGVTHLVDLGDDLWVEGESVVYGEGDGRRLSEVGWGRGRVVWICVKR